MTAPTKEKNRYLLALAEVVGQSLLDLLAPACERIEIAGSIRRRREDVGDIELLCVPRSAPPDMLGYAPPVPSAGDSVDQAVKELIAAGVMKHRRLKDGKTAYGPSNKLLAHVVTGIPVDIFSVPAENWGMALLVRTGPADYCVQVMERFRALGMQGHAYGGVTRGDLEIQCPTEEAVYDLLGWQYCPPERRGAGATAHWQQVRDAVRAAEERE